MRQVFHLANISAHAQQFINPACFTDRSSRACEKAVDPEGIIHVKWPVRPLGQYGFSTRKVPLTMASNITLSAGVRQNLLSLQSTASLYALLRRTALPPARRSTPLSTIPTNFFTSQSLSNRASDLNSLLDSIGQAQKTLEAADKGLTSLTKLVESAKSIAKQARQAPQPRREPTARSASTPRPMRKRSARPATAAPITVREQHARTRSPSTSTAPAFAPSTITSDGRCHLREIRDGLIADFNDRTDDCGLHGWRYRTGCQRGRRRHPASTRCKADVDFVDRRQHRRCA